MIHIFKDKATVLANFTKMVTADNKIDISTYKVKVQLNSKYDGVMKIFDMEGNWIQTLPLIIDVNDKEHKYLVPKNKIRINNNIIDKDTIYTDSIKYLPNYVTKPEFTVSKTRVDHETLDD